MRRDPRWADSVCDGVIKSVRQRGGEFPWVATVEYIVDGMTYEFKESLKVKSRVIKLGPIPIGQRKTPVMPNSNVGDRVAVCYSPHDPSKAYLRDNVGIANI